MLGMPAETAYDLKFRLLGIPVRIHPFFWLIMALLGWQDGNLPAVAVWVVCAFFSILVHEFGHGLMSRAFRGSPSIVLYGMGGLCASEGDRQTPWQRLAVLFCGPGAGFLLIAFIWGVYLAAGMPTLRPLAATALADLTWINVGWGILNLFPLWPLDGGQITGVVLTMLNRRQGMRWAHVVSLLSGGLLAAAAFTWLRHDLFYTLFFAYFALVNFQVLQAMHNTAKYDLSDDESWRA